MPVPQIQEQIVEVVKMIPMERVSERIVEQVVDVAVSLIVMESVGMSQSVPQEQNSRVFREEITDVSDGGNY